MSSSSDAADGAAAHGAASASAAAAAGHAARIVDQFTRQAGPFNAGGGPGRGIADDAALAALVAAARAGPSDVALDVACGGGLVVCALAAVAAHATGVDVTPAMLDVARRRAAARGADNVAWVLADVGARPLPFSDGSFSLVVSRFAFHHLVAPGAVLREMVRVCASGGRVLVADVVAPEDPARAAAFNAVEALRDPSHVRALPLSELRRLFAAAGLPPPREAAAEIRDSVENLLGRSFPATPGDADRVRVAFAASATDGSLGIEVHASGEYAYPVCFLCADRP